MNRQHEHQKKERAFQLTLLRDLDSDATSILVLICTLAMFVAESVTVTVKVAVPTVVGVPLIVPVVELRVNPAGSEPVVTDQVYGLTPPVAASVAE